MVLWRISNHATLNGMGGMEFSARWHTKGRPIVYTADHPASALLEMLAHTEPDQTPDTFQLLKIVAQPPIKPHRAAPPTDWMNNLKLSREIGDVWLRDKKSLLLEVPSAILPDVFHTLINPEHPDAKDLKIASAQKVPLDARLK
jgi:RES domain-containing protein